MQKPAEPMDKTNFMAHRNHKVNKVSLVIKNIYFKI